MQFILKYVFHISIQQLLFLISKLFLSLSGIDKMISGKSENKMATNVYCKKITDCTHCQKMKEEAFTLFSLKKGHHRPPTKCTQNCILFLAKGELLVNSEEYAGITLKANQFILQAIGSKIEALAMTDCELVLYRFNEPFLLCEESQRELLQTTEPPLIRDPLNMVPAMTHFIASLSYYVTTDNKICEDLLKAKRMELSYILTTFYTLRELASLFHSIAQYTDSFHYFVMNNYSKVRNVEEFAHLGGYTVTTFRRLFRNMFEEPAYEWMLKKKKSGILEDLYHSKLTISDISNKYAFESLPHFSNFCKTHFGNSPRALRNKKKEKTNN